MITSLRHRWQAMRSSFWFVPAVWVLMAVVLAILLVTLDTTVDLDLYISWPLLFGVGAAGAYGLLTTVATSMITVAGLVFSIALVALSLTSSQYTSRVGRNFMRDGVNQWVLGIFLGIFAYCLVVLGTMGGEQIFGPTLAVLAGLLLAFVGIAALIHFVHPIATSIQASSIVGTAAQQTFSSVNRLFPNVLQENEDDDEDHDLVNALARQPWSAIPAGKTGYTESFDKEVLLDVARDLGTILRIEHSVGEFVVEGTPLVSLRDPRGLDATSTARRNAAFAIGHQRTVEQHVAFGTRQIVDGVVSPPPARSVTVLVRSAHDRTRLATVAGIAMLLLVSAAHAVAQDVSPVVPPQAVKVVPEASDAKIEERLQRILQSTGWFEATRVSVHDGVVFLDGMTGTQEHRDWAGKLAEKTQGAVAVVNRIEASADVGSTFSRAGDEFTNFYRQIVRTWPLVALAALIVLATWLIARLVALAVRLLLAGRIESPLLLSMVARASAIPIFLLGIYFVLQFSGLTRLAITVLGGTGLIGIIIGFGLRDIAENFLASILLSVRNPFHSGDLIDVGGHTGVVQNLNVRSTVLLTLDGNQVQIPNSIVYKSIIKNYSSIPSRRAEFRVGIGYDSSAARAQVLIADVLKEHPAVLDTPEPLVLVEELGPATVDLRIYYWFDSAAYSPYKINSALLRQTKNALLKNGIELPDSSREIIFPKGVPFVQMKSTAEKSMEAEHGAVEARADDEMSDTTPSEGDLSNETVEMREQQSEGNLPEARENLLKK